MTVISSNWVDKTAASGATEKQYEFYLVIDTTDKTLKFVDYGMADAIVPVASTSTSKLLKFNN